MPNVKKPREKGDGPEAISIVGTQQKMPKTSWWIGLSRDEFEARRKVEHERLILSREGRSKSGGGVL